MTNNSSSSSRSVPSIHILDADSTLFDCSEFFTDTFNIYAPANEDASLYPCSQVLQPEYSNPFSELDDMPELSHLATPSQPYLTDQGYTLPYSIIQEDGASGGLSPSSLGSPIPSPASSFAGSLSPYESAFSDSDTPLSPSPTTPDDPFFWSTQGLSQPLIESFPDDSAISTSSIGPQSGPQRPRSHSSPSMRRPVASKAMLEANGRRRRHPAQFECAQCNQTFTALFSLKRHQQSHTGERPFACSIAGCNQRFFNSSDCKRHEKSVKRHKRMTQSPM